MGTVTKLKTPFSMQAEFNLLKADCLEFSKRVEVHSDALEKLSARYAAQQVLEKAQAKETRRALRKVQVNKLGADIASFDAGMTKRAKRNRPLSK